MNAAKDLFYTASMLGLIMFAIVGTFYSTMDRPLAGSPLVSLSDGR